MAVNYDDQRFKDVENEKQTELNKTTDTYNEMINNTDSYYQKQIDASKDWQKQQTDLQKQQTQFAIDKIEQQKEQAKKDYEKEQRGAYTDYQKEANQYGVNAEKLATQGLSNTGYSESSRVNMYNTYQNRYTAARESYNKAVLNYDNAIKEAQLANSSTLAQIAYEALQKQLELSLQGFQYKNDLILQKTNALNSVNDRYYSRYQDVLNQINTENQLAEQIRQYNENLAFQKQKAAQEQANWEKEYALTLAKSKASSGGGSSSKSSSSSSGAKLTNNSSKLGEYATKLKNNLSIALKNAGRNTGMARTQVKNAIYNAYSSGQISDSEASSIYEALGI